VDSQSGSLPTESRRQRIFYGYIVVGAAFVMWILYGTYYTFDERRLRIVSFMTDGYIGNEAEILGELQATLGENTRLFSIGVGSSPNRYLIEGLSEEGRGHAYYVSLNEDPSDADATTLPLPAV